MSKSDLEKFERRLGLAAYFMHLFGVEDPTDERQVRSLLTSLNDLKEGYHGERSELAKHLASRQRCRIPAERLFEYDANIREHVAALNQRRDQPLRLKYFQMLAVLCSEIYLDRATREPAKFRHDVNRFLKRANEDKNYHYQFAIFEEGDLDGSGKLAYWMATGSGKTLVMHVNYYQWIHYASRRQNPVDNLLLLTPNAGLTRQHIDEMRQSGVPCRYFHDPDKGREDVVKVLEITKLTDDASGEGESVEIDAFEGNNVIFVDEGHKGASGDAWMHYRRRIARRGFTFEYSATFGQAIAGNEKDLQLDYGKAIALNYSYPYFYEDGYGKDYHILNLEEEVDPELTDRYLLANLLTFVEQKLCYESDPETARRDYNIAEPLLMFVGNSVTAGKTLGSLSTNEERSLSDVQKLVAFLDRVLRNAKGWVSEAIDLILSGRSRLLREDGTDLFENVFSYLKKLEWDGERIYREMLEKVFHTDASAPLQLVDLESADGEIGLRAGAVDQYFGVIDIGNERAFLKLAEEELPTIGTDADAISESLFQNINQRDSDVQMLLGSRKFIEGWSSWRVSAMGLMNFGQSPGPLIIQLFGRGVRLKGKGLSLKRSRALEGSSSQNIQRLETLHIFGVRAKYMSDFRKYLEREGIDVDEWEELEVEVPVETREEFTEEELLTPRVEEQTDTRFVGEEVVLFELDTSHAPTVDLRVNVEDIDSAAPDLRMAGGRAENGRQIPPRIRQLLDWQSLETRLWQHARANDYQNLVLRSEQLREVIADPRYYRLYCPETMLEGDTSEGLRRIERIVSMLLTKYLDNLYSAARKQWEQQQRDYQDVEPGDPNLPEAIRARYQRDSAIKDQLENLETFLQEAPEELYEEDEGLPPRVHFERHLYAPLLLDHQAATEKGEADQLALRFSPPGLNSDEMRFVRRLADFTRSEMGARLRQDYELFLLRNQSRGAGVSFFVQPTEGAAHEKVYPDFIVWLKSDELQHIIFVDPHGLTHAGNLFRDPKVRLHETIKDDQRLLAAKTGREDVRLHSFVVSATDFNDLPTAYSDEELESMRDAGVYFPDANPNYLTDLFAQVTTVPEA